MRAATLAARACGVRVTEFFLGLPCRFDIHRTSRRIGTKFGVTPLLLGGYAAICGMDPTDVSCADRVLAAIYRHGRVSVADLSVELELPEEDVLEACALLLGWGSIAPWYEEGEKPSPSYYPVRYQTLPRDAAGYTTFDGRKFDREHATAEGDVELPVTASEFFEQERSHTYLGQGFLKRAFMLLAGILVNILTGFLLLMSIYSIAGVSVPVDSNVIGQVEEGSIAAKAGIEAGDAILSVDGVSCSSWMDVYDAIGKAAGQDDIAIEYQRDGKKLSTSVALRRASVWAFMPPRKWSIWTPLRRRACRSPMFSRLPRALCVCCNRSIRWRYSISPARLLASASCLLRRLPPVPRHS